MISNDLNHRLRRLEDIRAVELLMQKHAFFIDTSQYESIIDLYASDAVIEFSIESLPNCGIYRGKEQIVMFHRDWLGSLEGRWVSHNVLNPLIEVEGDWATGIVYFIAMTMYGPTPEEKMAYWTHSRMDNIYQRIGGKWFIKRERIFFNICRSPYDKGWHKEGFMNPLKPGQPQQPRLVSQ
ncbi:nuclear transport factor 2 family protein [Chloroflexota bacterium]